MAGGNVPANQVGWFQSASKATGVPAAVLAGIASVETNLGANTATSSTGAQGELQFEPGTAKQFGLNPYNTQQAILDAGKLLVDYGYNQNPSRAIGAYNGGPGNPQYGYAQQVISEAKRLAPQLAGTASAAVPGVGSQPQGPSSSSSASVPVTTQAFDQAGFKEAMGRFLAGSFVQQQGSASNPYNASPGASKGFSGSLSGANPLFASGQLTTTAPNAQDFVTTQTGTVAQHQLQQLAGPATPLATHPAVAGSANKILQMALSVLGAPYNQATHASALTETAAQLKKTGTDCSGFVSWLMGPDGLGIWKTALATPDIQHAPGMQAGTGQTITVYNNPLPGNSGHVFVEIDGRFFQSAGGGVGIQAISSAEAQQMIKGGDNGAPYTALHPKGF